MKFLGESNARAIRLVVDAGDEMSESRRAETNERAVYDVSRAARASMIIITLILKNNKNESMGEQ